MALFSITVVASKTAGQSGTAKVITGDGAAAFMVGLAALFVLVGVVIVIERSVKARPKHPGDFFSPSVTRSWIALAISGAVILLAGASFLVDDTSSRSTLLGAAAATLGSVTAYYFASRQGENAIAAAAGSVATSVPDLTGKTFQEALAAAGATNFAVQLSASSLGDLSTAVVKSQTPVADSSAPSTSVITLTLGAR